mgnify:CR=1 FL=1
MRAVSTILCFVAMLSGQGVLFAQNLAPAAKQFLQSLSAEQKKLAQFPVDSDERSNWHMIPRTRRGVCYKNLSEAQRSQALSLLRESLSTQGYTKSYDIMKNEALLRELEGRAESDTYRDPLNYYLSFFGEPTETGNWGWRFEGHHLSLNLFSSKGSVKSSTPTSMGSNPGVVPSGKEKGRELLKQETHLAFTLVNALDDQQKRICIFSATAPPELVTLGVRNAELLEPKGIPFGQLTGEQKRLATELLRVYVSNYSDEFSAELNKRLESEGIDKLTFAWAGSLKPGSWHYYRIQSSFLLIEYDNTQNNANHVHVAVRDLTRDFGNDILREHYRTEHNK